MNTPATGSGMARGTVGMIAGLFIVSYGTNVSTPFLVTYKQRLELTQSATMAIFVVYVAGILGALLIAGPMSDRFGRRPIVLPMVAVSGGASLVMIAGRDEFVWLLVGRLFLGVGTGAALGVGAAWLLELLGPGQEQRAAMITTFVSFAGFGIGPPISALLDWLAPSPLVVPFVLHSVATAIVFVVMWTIPETHPPNRSSKFTVRLGVPKRSRRVFALLIAPAAVWVFGFPSTSFALFPVLVSDSIGGGEVAVAAVAAALTAWSGILARPVIARLGHRRVLPVGMVMGVLGYVAGATAFATDVWPLVLIAAPLLGWASGLITVGCLTLIGMMAEDDQRGAMTTSFYLFAYPGMAMPLAITSFGSVTSISTSLVAVTMIAAVGAVFVALVSRRDDLTR